MVWVGVATAGAAAKLPGNLSMNTLFRIAWVGLLLAVLVGCRQASDPKVYAVRGVVRELRADGRTAVIAHEEIPGYMAAMTMPLEVRDPAELKDVTAGDTVTFRMLVTEKDGWIDQVKVVARAASAATNAVAAPEPEPAFTVLPNVPELNVGDAVPDYSFTNELGQVVRLSEFRGKATAITFIFTRCPFPNFCPRMTDHFKTVQKTLLTDGNAPKNWKLLSISFDPGFDTPGTLRAYGKARSYDPEKWSLLTGDLGQIAPLCQHFGLYFSRTSQPAAQNHNLRTVVIDPAGKVQKIFIGNEWTPEELVAEIRAAAVKR